VKPHMPTSLVWAVRADGDCTQRFTMKKFGSFSDARKFAKTYTAEGEDK
jgi:hypothetical protein